MKGGSRLTGHVNAGGTKKVRGPRSPAKVCVSGYNDNIFQPMKRGERTRGCLGDLAAKSIKNNEYRTQ